QPAIWDTPLLHYDRLNVPEGKEDRETLDPEAVLTKDLEFETSSGSLKSRRGIDPTGSELPCLAGGAQEEPRRGSRWGWLARRVRRRGRRRDRTCGEIRSAKLAVSMKDNKEEALPTGLVNQGNTCYLNSLLQTMFHVPGLREAVLLASKEKAQGEGGTLPALGRVFAHLEKGERAASTSPLTRVMGIDPRFQQDAQEFGRMLFMTLEEEAEMAASDGDMECGAVGEVISKLFSGKLINYIECMDVPFSREASEVFYDLPMDVKGCKTLQESLDRFTEPERLSGDNRWRAGEHGLQEANKGVRFVEFPPVLQFHLKRFQYDPYQDSMSKVHDRFEFPVALNTSPWLKGDSANSTASTRYSLRAVVMHVGGHSAGHYYSYVRPLSDKWGEESGGEQEGQRSKQWVKLDDDRVTAVTEEEVLRDAYGGG
ncbi:unnamed protein product, partial [Choristocarpus tenellus]